MDQVREVYLWGEDSGEKISAALPEGWRLSAIEENPDTLAGLSGGLLLVSPDSKTPPPLVEHLEGNWVLLEMTRALRPHRPPRQGPNWAHFEIPGDHPEHTLGLVLPMAEALLECQHQPASAADLSEIMSNLGYLLRVAGTFRVVDDVEEVYDKLTDQLCTRFPFRRAMLFLRDSKGAFTLRSLSWPEGDEQALIRILEENPPKLSAYSPEYESFTLGRSMPLQLNDSDFFAPVAAAKLAPAPEVALVPLFTDKEFIGVIEADFDDQPARNLGEADLALLEAFATLVGSLLFSRRLFAELERKNRELRLRLREMSLVESVTRIINQSGGAQQVIDDILFQVAQALEADFGFVYLYDKDAQRLELQDHRNLNQPGVEAREVINGITPESLESLDPEFSPVEGSGPLLTRTLKGLTGVMGLWGIGRREGSRPFSKGEEQILANVDQHAEVAINSLRMHRLATTDALTGLFSRRHFREALAQELKIRRYMHYPVTLIMMDIDEFKHVNDTYGHPGGDEVLKAMAGLITEGRRDSDVCARLGGDEMAMILPRCSLDSAVSMAEGLRRRCEEMVVDYQSQPMRITLSIGLAVALPDDDIWDEELISFADQALYKAKESGRNAVRAYQE